MLTSNSNSEYLVPRRPPPLSVRTETVRPGVKSFGYLLMASALMTYVPSLNVGTLIFVAAMLLFFLYQISTVRIRIATRRDLAAVLFVGYGCLSYATLSYNGYGFEEWSRAMVPFLFFLLLPMIPTLFQTERVWLSKALFLASMIWLIRILAEAAVLVSQGSNVLSVRLTYNVVDSVIPFPMIIVPYLLFVKTPMSSWLKWGLLAFVLYIYVWIGYRAGLVIIIFPFLLFFALRMTAFNIVPLLIMLFGCYMLIGSGIFDQFSLTERFTNLSDESAGPRGLEWAYALEQFVSSPVIGRGMGWQVPTSITFYGLEFSDITSASQVGYVHSALAYMAMNLGLIGVAIYFYLTIPRVMGSDKDGVSLFSSVALLVLLSFCMTQASFRLIQTVLMMVALIRLNAMPTK